MPDVIFCDNAKDQILGDMNSGSYSFRQAYARVAIYTAGNGLANINGGTTMSYFTGLTTGRLWFADIGNVTITYGLPGDKGAMQVSTPNIVASASGVAAEFLFYSAAGSSGSAFTGCIGGTVTAAGGGGDMVIADTNIVSGNTYRVQNWVIRILADFTY